MVCELDAGQLRLIEEHERNWTSKRTSDNHNETTNDPEGNCPYQIRPYSLRGTLGEVDQETMDRH